MMRLDFVRFLEEGSSRPFIARDQGGRLWVAKYHGNPLGTKSSFNEFVAGSLANEIGLPWPWVSIGSLTDAALQRLSDCGLQVLSEKAVAIQHIASIRPIGWPPGGLSELRTQNPGHIHKHFPDRTVYSAFYGKMLFDNWVLLEDTKYDTLHTTEDGKPVFLDASFAFAGEEWDADLLVWRDTAFGIVSPYLEGIITDLSPFDTWMERLAQVDHNVISRILASIPASWGVPHGYSDRVQSFISRTREEFVPIAQEWITWRRQ